MVFENFTRPGFAADLDGFVEPPTAGSKVLIENLELLTHPAHSGAQRSAALGKHGGYPDRLGDLQGMTQRGEVDPGGEA